MSEAARAPDDHPMVDRERGLVFFWTPRCGSTTFLIWFFHLIGWGKRLASASAHQLRAEWYSEHESLLGDESLVYRDPGLRRFVIARDPYSRAVSSHYLILTSQPAKQWRSVELALPAADEERRLSWYEWLDFLEQEDLETCNVHWRLQSAKRWWELRAEVELLRTETLDGQLTALGEDLGVPDLPLRRASSTPRYEGSLDGVDVRTLARPALAKLMGREARPGKADGKLRFPSSSAFLDSESTARLTRLYARDLEALEYETRTA